MRHRILLAVLTAMASVAGAEEPALRSVVFHRDVVNLEDFMGPLASAPPSGMVKVPGFAGDTWFGEIPRQLPGDPIASHAHDVLFAVVFDGGNVVRARADTNLNGDFSDDPDVRLSLYPGERPGRSFLVTLPASGRAPRADNQGSRLVRVVVPPAGGETGDRTYKTQEVYGMLGTAIVDGRERLLLLYDANHDGLYSKGNGDGVFIDMDGDRHFAIAVMEPGFGPLAVPFAFGPDRVVVADLDPSGARLTLRTVGTADVPPEPEVGRPVLDFAFVGADGRAVLLSAQRGRTVVVYFWSSSSQACRERADALRVMVEHYDADALSLLAVSYDSDRGAMERFRREHGQTWPSSFSGGVPSEDPVGRLFRESGTGQFYVIDPEGRLVAKTDSLGVLNDWLAKLATDARATRRRPRRSAPSRPAHPEGTASPGTRARRLGAGRRAVRTPVRGR